MRKPKTGANRKKKIPKAFAANALKREKIRKAIVLSVPAPNEMEEVDEAVQGVVLKSNNWIPIRSSTKPSRKPKRKK